MGVRMADGDFETHPVGTFQALDEKDQKIKKLQAALKGLAECKGKTLLGCNCDNYMHCDCGETAYRAHERGANEAFEDCAGIASKALEN